MRVLVVTQAVLVLMLVSTGYARAESVDVDVNKSGPRSFTGQARVVRDRSLGRKAPRPISPPSSKQATLPSDQRAAVKKLDKLCAETEKAGKPCVENSLSETGNPDPTTKPKLSLIAHTLITQVRLPSPKPLLGPDPSVNRWKKAFVGHPIWLWTAGPTTVTDTASAYGVKFSLTAKLVSTQFDTGDRHRQTCTRTTPYANWVTPGAKSPTCGHTYQQPSPHGHDYTLTATTRWRITWRALGQTGTIHTTHTGTRQLPVSELHALIIK